MAKSERLPTTLGVVSDLPPFPTPSDGKLSGTQVDYIISRIRALIAAINGRLTFGDGVHSSQSGNIDGQVKEVLFVTANADYEVPHGLGRLPCGIIVLLVNVDGAVVRGSSTGSWNAERIFVRCNQANTTARFVVV